MVGEQDAAGRDAEQLAAAGGEPVQELDDVEVVDESVRQLDEHLSHPSVGCSHQSSSCSFSTLSGRFVFGPDDPGGPVSLVSLVSPSSCKRPAITSIATLCNDSPLL